MAFVFGLGNGVIFQTVLHSLHFHRCTLLRQRGAWSVTSLGSVGSHETGSLQLAQQVCDKAYFDAALDDICSRFLSIPNEEIESMPEALGAQYPAALIDHFKLYIDKIRKFCQE